VGEIFRQKQVEGGWNI